MRLKQVFNPVIFISVGGLLSISFFIIASTSNDLLFAHILSYLIGLTFLIIFSFLDYKIFLKIHWHLYFISLALLALTFLGPSVRGATRWIEIMGIRFQPSELVKPLLIVFFSAAYNEDTKKFVSLIKRFLLLLPVIFLIFRQPDLGNVIVYLGVFLTMEIVRGINWSYILAGLFSFGTLIPVIWHILKEYQKQRIISFLYPRLDPTGAGYNALQSVVAIGSGKIFGMGLGRGTQSRLLFLPEYHTDFIFASIVEALGFVGGSLVLFFYILILGKILQVVLWSDDLSTRLISSGVFMQIFIQVLINTGMNMGVLPITGITLPLISYGGSSTVGAFIALGLVISIWTARKKNPLVIS